MKKTAFIVSALFFIASCGSSDETGFLSPSKPTVGDADGGQKIVQVEIKVGVSDGKGGQSVRRPASSTGGAPSATGPKGQETDGETASSGESEEGGIGLPYSEEVALDESEKKSQKKVDILFYLGFKGHGTCWKHLGRSIENSGFFSHLNSFNWQTAAAFSSHDPELYNIRDEYGAKLSVGGNLFGFGAKPVYILKKGQFSSEESDKSLKGTVTVEYERSLHYDNGKGNEKSRDENLREVPVFLPLHKRAPEDPLWGLSKLLKENSEGFARSKSNTFVVILDSNYYYTAKEWQDFVRSRENIQFISLTSRKGAVSNHLPLLESEGNFKWMPCGHARVASHLAKHIKKAVR